MDSQNQYARRYRNNLIEAIDDLSQTEETIFFKIVNLAMSNELREIDEVFETGDDFRFELAHFEDSSDTNVNMLMDLLKLVSSTKESIANLNAIEDDEEKVDESDEASRPISKVAFAEKLDKQQKTLFELIDHILWIVWDPLGIHDIDGSEGAYTSYSIELFEQKLKKASMLELADFLYNTEMEIEGIAADFTNCEKVAGIIHAL